MSRRQAYILVLKHRVFSLERLAVSIGMLFTFCHLGLS
jgi:hypothetical protein